MENLLDRFAEKLESSLQKKFYHCRYVVKVSQIKGSFHIFVGKPRGKISNNDLDILSKTVKRIPTKCL